LLGRFLALSLHRMGLVVLGRGGGVLSLGQGVVFGLGLCPGDVTSSWRPAARVSCRDFFMTWSGVNQLPWLGGRYSGKQEIRDF